MKVIKKGIIHYSQDDNILWFNGWVIQLDPNEPEGFNFGDLAKICTLGVKDNKVLYEQELSKILKDSS